MRAPGSGYLQYVGMRKLIDISSRSDAVIRLLHRPGHFVVEGEPLAHVWPAAAAPGVARALGGAHATGPHRTLTQDPSFAVDQLVEIAIRGLSLGDQRHLYGARVHRLARRRARQARRALAARCRAPRPRRMQSACSTVPISIPSSARARPREDPPSERGYAGGDDPPARRPRKGDGSHENRRAARAAARAGGDDPASVRGPRCEEKADRADVRRRYDAVLSACASMNR